MLRLLVRRFAAARLILSRRGSSTVGILSLRHLNPQAVSMFPLNLFLIAPVDLVPRAPLSGKALLQQDRPDFTAIQQTVYTSGR